MRPAPGIVLYCVPIAPLNKGSPATHRHPCEAHEWRLASPPRHSSSYCHSWKHQYLTRLTIQDCGLLSACKYAAMQRSAQRKVEAVQQLLKEASCCWRHDTLPVMHRRAWNAWNARGPTLLVPHAPSLTLRALARLPPLVRRLAEIRAITFHALNQVLCRLLRAVCSACAFP